MSLAHRYLFAAYVFSCCTAVLVVACLVGFVLRWSSISYFQSLSNNAGVLGLLAAFSTLACLIAMVFASNVPAELPTAVAPLIDSSKL